MRTRLTKRTVEAIAPGAQDTIIWDEELRGFGLKVTPTGRRSYFVYYRTAAGQQRRPSIGQHGVITTDEARQIARRWLGDLAAGRDVSKERLDKRQAPTIADLADRYLRDYAEVHKKPRSITTDRANIQNHILPLIGTIKIADLTRADVEALKLAIRDGRTARTLTAKARGRRIIRGGEGIANRTLALLSKMLACAESWGLRDQNPAKGVRKFREHRKDRFLSEDEVGRLHQAIALAEAQRTENTAALAAIKLLLFTGMRSGEVAGLKVGDVDLSRGVLRLVDTKTGARHVVLNAPAVEIVRPFVCERSATEPLFASATGNSIALTRPWYRVRAAAGIDKTANLHCLRHTFASWGVMKGLSLAQVGALLGHRSAQTTLRYADHAIEAIRAYSDLTGDELLNAKSEGAPNE